MGKPSLPSEARRRSLLRAIRQAQPHFEASVSHIVDFLRREIKEEGNAAVLDYLFLASVIPEDVDYDSSEEKLFSKFTDAIVSLTFEWLGFRTQILQARADAADVRVIGRRITFVADAKSFRLSRTAKNQKDFKVEAMDRWKKDDDYAAVVAPSFHFPARQSQVYEQASRRSVCLLSYAHLRAWASVSSTMTSSAMEERVKGVLSSPQNLAKTTSASAYWGHVNDVFIRSNAALERAFDEQFQAEQAYLEKVISWEVASLQRREHAVRKMSHAQATAALIDAERIHERTQAVQSFAVNRAIFACGESPKKL